MIARGMHDSYAFKCDNLPFECTLEFCYQILCPEVRVHMYIHVYISYRLTLLLIHTYIGLDCLCSILKCMVEWSRDYYIDPATTGLNAVYRSSTGSDDTDDLQGRPGRAASVTPRLPPPSESSKCVHYSVWS